MPADSKRTAAVAGVADIGIGAWVEPGTGRYAADNKPLPGTPAAARADAAACKAGTFEAPPPIDQTKPVEIRLHIGGIPTGVDAAAVASRIAPFGQVVGQAHIVDKAEVGFNIDPMSGRPKIDGGATAAFGSAVAAGNMRKIYAYVDVLISPMALKRCQAAYHGSKWRGKQLTIAVANRSHIAVLEERWAHERDYQVKLA